MPIKRLTASPIIYPKLDDRYGENINGPSLIKVPDWVENPLGRYYLYFAHHNGLFIRMAFADDLTGPYTSYSPGVLSLEDTPFQRHIASPDIKINHTQQKIIMHYHGPVQPQEVPYPHPQATAYAESEDGLSFHSDRVYLGESYIRTFFWEGYHYGFSGGGLRRWLRTRDPREPFEEGPTLDIAGESFVNPQAYVSYTPEVLNASRIRHVGLHHRGPELDIYYSCVRDAPERIKRTTVNLDGDWTTWHGTSHQEILRPELTCEGRNLPIAPSRSGAQTGQVHELRDPYIYEEDERCYMVYSIAGESGLMIAEII
ncbi:MAG: hypothetical protein AAF629_13200 [Chloroflexota bacterium]